MEEQRQICIQICNDFIGKTHSKNIEKCLYEYSEDSCSKYMTKLKYIFQIINPKSSVYNKVIVDDIKKNELNHMILLIIIRGNYIQNIGKK